MNCSVVILTKNEEKNIAECLKTLDGFEEIILIDDNSIDNTVKLAQKMGAKVYTRDSQGDFATQRNFGFTKTQGNWVLFIDADERLTPELNYEIQSHINDPMSREVGFLLNRRDIVWGTELTHGESGKNKFLRLAKKGYGEWSGVVHEVWRVKGQVSLLKHPLLHYPHQTLREFLTEINYYTDLRAQELYEAHKKVRTLDVLFYPVGKFLQNYFLKLGILDGIAGLVYAVLMSFHSFLVRGKLWLKLQTENQA